MLRFAFVLILLAGPAAAQPQQSPMDKAIFERVTNEVVVNIAARAKIIELQAAVDSLAARVRALEDKYEPKLDGK